MERRINANHPMHDLLSRRWSPRAFSSRLVEPAKLQVIFEAARWAPSSSNEQPWAFIVGTIDRPEDHKRILDCLVPKNQEWARSAPVLIISAARRNFERNQTPNRHAFYDVGQATAYLTMQALDLGLYVHQMAGFSPDAARSSLGIPDSADAVTAIALGYMGDVQSLPEGFRERETTPSTRKPMSDFLFEGRWSQKAPWANR